MSWPWVSAAEHLSVKERLRWTEEQLRAAENRIGVKEAQLAAMTRALEQAEAERRKLTDRILAMSGQAPLFEAAPAPEPAGKQQVDVKDLAKADLLPTVGMTFRGVHAAARRAMAEGQFDVQAAIPRR